MNIEIKSVAVYTISIAISTIVFIQIGAEIITQYSMYTNGYSGIERHHLADDMGFAFLLMIGLIPEIILGIGCGTLIGKKINAKLKNT